MIEGPASFRVCDAPQPSLRGDGEVLLRTLASGICSGDLMPWYLARKAGTVFGHEPAGRAVEVGSAVQHIRPGDLVFAHHHAPCLACEDCGRGAYVHCQEWKASKLDPGGMAEVIRIPAGIVARDCFAVNDLSAEQALFIEPLACCVKALSQVGVAGLHVGVVGCGVMGLLNIEAAFALGAARVTAIEPGDARRKAASRIASEVMAPEQASMRLRHALDVAIIGPGVHEVIQQALGFVRPAGAAVLFTPTPSQSLTPLDLGELYFREVRLIPSYSCGPTDTRQAYQLIREGKVRPERHITHRFGLEQFPEAFDVARAGGDAIKVVITFPEAR